MLDKFRERRNEEDGFTLVELLVVMLILGILAAIAIPAFFSQRDKGYDSDAKANVRTVQTALETYAVDNDGDYTGASLAALGQIEGAVNDIASDMAEPTVTADTYSITANSDSGTTFTLARGADGTLTYTCSSPGDGGCPSPAPGDWG